MRTHVLITPWDYHQSWNDGSYSYDGHTILWEHRTIPVTDYIKQRYLSPVWYLNQLIEHWELLGAITLFLSDGTTASTTELSQALNTEISVINQAVELGFSMGWFDVGDKISLIFLEEKCDNSIYAPALVEVLGLPDSAQVGNSWESARTITTVQTSSVNDSPVSTTTETCEVYQFKTSEELTLLQLQHPVSPSPSTVNDWEQPTSETVSPQCWKVLPESNLNSFVSKTLPDCSPVQATQENHQGHILEARSQPLTAAGMMRNGFVYVQDTLPHPFLENDYFWLESPGALSSIGNGRPPGQTKLEAQLKKLGLLHKGEVLNPVILSEWYDIPPSWLDPWESRPATALLENKDRQQEIFLTPELQRSLSPEFNTLQASPGTTEKFLEENSTTEESGKETPTTEKFLEENSITEESGKETPTTEKFLEETLSTDKSRACGCLYQYIENKKLKNGSIVSYPRVDGERDKHNYTHWRWGYSWEEKIGGEWKNRSVGVSNKIVHAVGNMINNGNTVQNIREFIALSKNSRKSNQ
ncbi:MAG: DNA methylase [Aphanizomenon gracile PMC644.10]|nr:DNA methylase [Aphanizomenon gracile PMC644.10]